MERDIVLSWLNGLAHENMRELKLYLINNEIGFLGSSVEHTKKKIAYYHPEITIDTIVEFPVITCQWVDEIVSDREGKIYTKDLSY